MSMPRWFIYSNRRNPGSALLHLSGKFGPRAPLGIRGNKSLGQGARENRRRGNKWKIPLRLYYGGEDYDGGLGRDGAGRAIVWRPGARRRRGARRVAPCVPGVPATTEPAAPSSMAHARFKIVFL